MRKRFIIAEILVILLSACHASRSQTPLKPPLPAGTTYFNGPIVAQRGVGIIGCTNQQFILGDASGCSGGSGQVSTVFITDPPYNAKCDGTSDDTVAIQAALNSGAALVQYPVSTTADQIQCNHASTLHWPASALTVEFNGSEDNYTGTGISWNIDNAVNEPFAIMKDALISISSPTGSPIGIGSPANSGNIMLYNVYFLGSSSPTALSMSLNGEEDVYLYGVYGFGASPFVLGAAVIANHFEITCAFDTQDGLTLPQMFTSAYSSTSISGCAHGIHVENSGRHDQTLVLNSDDFTTNADSALELDSGNDVTITGTIDYENGTSPVFSNEAYFTGNLYALDKTTGNTTHYQSQNQIFSDAETVTIIADAGVDPSNGGTVVCATGYQCNSKYGTLLVTMGTTPSDADIATIEWTVAKQKIVSANVQQVVSSSTGNAFSCLSGDADTSSMTQVSLYNLSASCTVTPGATGLVSYVVYP